VPTAVLLCAPALPALERAAINASARKIQTLLTRRFVDSAVCVIFQDLLCSGFDSSMTACAR
jgi:hypothetical protein